LKFHKKIVMLTLIFAVFATIALATLGTAISADALSTDQPIMPEMVYTAFFLWVIIPFLVLKLIQGMKERKPEQTRTDATISENHHD
jgi:hypothetical protein